MGWIVASVFVLKATEGQPVSRPSRDHHTLRDRTSGKILPLHDRQPWHDVVNFFYNKKHRAEIEAYRPLVSVMIPAWNESQGILNTMKTVLLSTYRNMELVVVNDGSTDDSDKLIRNFLADYESWTDGVNDIRIIYDYKSNGGKGRALNRAIELSHGDIIISIDADCIVLPDTIENFVSCFSNPRVMAAVGNVKIGNTTKIIGVIQYLEYLFSFYFKKAESILNTIYIIGGAAGAFAAKSSRSSASTIPPTSPRTSTCPCASRTPA